MEKYKYNDEEFRFMENSGVPFGIYQVIDEQIYTIVLTKGFLDLFGYADMPREEVYQMLLMCNGIPIDICINKKDLFGEPEVGRRFKGSVWLQGWLDWLS